MDRILIVDDDQALTQTLSLYFQGKNLDVLVAGSSREALELWQKAQPDLILLDVQLPDLNGPQLLDRAKKLGLKGDVVMITAFQDTEATLHALSLGAIDYLYKPLDLDDLDLLIKKVDLRKKERDKIEKLTYAIKETYKPRQIVGRSKGILNVVKAIVKVSKNPSTVLIEGETGTGKELVAQTIHYQSAPNEPFMGINCASMLASLLESELFGYEKGAFTGATQKRIGKLEYAGRGTLFLDEISELPLELQAKFLRVLQEREFQRVGGVKSIPFRARVIAATNRNLEELVKEGKFREDLFFRLKVFVIRIPPLRERREDIVPLVEYFINQLNLELHKKVKRIPKTYLDALVEYDWPGNVRELQNVLRRAMILTEGEVLEFDPQWLRKDRSEKPSTSSFDPENGTPKKLVEIEKEHIINVLKYTRGNYGEACRILGISRPTLRKKIRDYDITVTF